ncbi:MAG TPA: transglutaminase family protein [Xanthobacteraceae bacterium]|nr:transglutaminase family protein [Xanthobacteraceae bacterium]
MRLYIAHSTVYRFDPPAAGAVQVLRLTPRNHDGQYVVRWRIDVSADARLTAHEDAFGNITHTFSVGGPLDELRVGVDGEVETQDTEGIVRGAVERFPPSLFLRDTPLTRADQPIRDFAQRARADADGGSLQELHALLQRLHDNLRFDTDATYAATDAAQAFALGRGVCQDFAHIFISAAHTLSIPARYVTGYLCLVDGTVAQEAGHAWAEAFVPDLGWVGFDPANGICATDAYVRVAIGLDALGAAPVRGTRYGATGETLTVTVTVNQ